MIVELQNEIEGIRVSERIHLVPSLMKTNMEYTFSTHAKKKNELFYHSEICVNS